MKKIKKYLLFVVALFSLFVVNTKAAQISSDSFGLTLDNNNLPYSFNLNNSTKKMNVLLYSYESQKNYTYLVFDVCSTGNFSNLKIINNGYNSYFNDNSALVVRTSTSCNVSGYDGTLYKLQMQVGKFSDFDEAGELYAGSYLQFSFAGKYNAFYKFSDAYLSDVDVVTPLLNASNDSKKQQEIIDKQTETNSKLDDVKSKQDEAENTRKGILGTIKDVLSNIVNLPKKIVEFLIDALKSLFVPTDEQLYEIVNDSKELAENFGFVGEAVAFFLNIFTSLLGMVNANGCIEMPAFKIGATSLFEEHTFWEARNVCLADNAILSANIDTIRTITSIAFVSLFLGFAASKFFGILSKNDSGTSMTYDENDNSFIVNDWSRTNGITYNRRYKS